MNTDANGLEWDSVLQSQGVEREGVSCGDKSMDLFESNRSGEVRLECL